MKNGKDLKSYDWLLIILPIPFAFASYIYNCSDISHDWFSASGAVMTVSGLSLQLRRDRQRIEEIKYAIDITSIANIPYGGYLYEKYNLVNCLSILYSIVGTLIWGYGNLAV